MLTHLTRIAIAILNDIYLDGGEQNIEYYDASAKDITELLRKLEAAGLIMLADKKYPERLSSYKPTHSLSDISLLDILEATGEHLNCNCPTSEELYSHYRNASHKLGIVNQLTRLYLQEIKLYDL